jgi:hypothetical protein
MNVAAMGHGVRGPLHRASGLPLPLPIVAELSPVEFIANTTLQRQRLSRPAPLSVEDQSARVLYAATNWFFPMETTGHSNFGGRSLAWIPPFALAGSFEARVNVEILHHLTVKLGEVLHRNDLLR